MVERSCKTIILAVRQWVDVIVNLQTILATLIYRSCKNWSFFYSATWVLTLGCYCIRLKSKQRIFTIRLLLIDKCDIDFTDFVGCGSFTLINSMRAFLVWLNELSKWRWATLHRICHTWWAWSSVVIILVNGICWFLRFWTLSCRSRFLSSEVFSDNFWFYYHRILLNLCLDLCDMSFWVKFSTLQWYTCFHLNKISLSLWLGKRFLHRVSIYTTDIDCCKILWLLGSMSIRRDLTLWKDLI